MSVGRCRTAEPTGCAECPAGFNEPIRHRTAWEVDFLVSLRSSPRTRSKGCQRTEPQGREQHRSRFRDHRRRGPRRQVVAARRKRRQEVGTVKFSICVPITLRHAVRSAPSVNEGAANEGRGWCVLNSGRVKTDRLRLLLYAARPEPHFQIVEQ